MTAKPPPQFSAQPNPRTVQDQVVTGLSLDQGERFASPNEWIWTGDSLGTGGGCWDPAGRAPSHCRSQPFLSWAFWGPFENLSGKQKKEEQLLGHSLLVPVSWQSQELFWLKKKKRLWFTSLINYFYLVLTQSFLWILSIEIVAANSVCYSFSGHSNSPSKELSLLTLAGTCLSLDKTTQFSDCRIYHFSETNSMTAGHAFWTLHLPPSWYMYFFFLFFEEAIWKPSQVQLETDRQTDTHTGERYLPNLFFHILPENQYFFVVHI